MDDEFRWLLGYALLGLIFGGAGWSIGRRKNRGLLGFILGFFLNLPGLIALALILRKDDDGPPPSFS